MRGEDVHDHQLIGVQQCTEGYQPAGHSGCRGGYGSCKLCIGRWSGVELPDEEEHQGRSDEFRRRPREECSRPGVWRTACGGNGLLPSRYSALRDGLVRQVLERKRTRSGLSLVKVDC